MTAVASFAPIARADARVLILGSMPGVASLQAQRYYAHPRNAFWTILGDYCGIPAQASYEARIAALQDAGIALWDVLASCVRRGSLDADIARDQAVANDLASLYAALPGLQRVLFNGASAADWYRRLQLPQPADLAFVRLPSTSPAHAGMNLAAKSQLWHAALRGAADGVAAL